jgi:antitoxin component YwqK of YwqJK toxin-antitoxin module
MTKEINRFKEGPAGDISEERNYEDSVLHGRYVKYFDNGNVEKVGAFINGSREGTTWIEFYKSGMKYREYLFTENKEMAFDVISMWDEAGVQTVREGERKTRNL